MVPDLLALFGTVNPGSMPSPSGTEALSEGRRVSRPFGESSAVPGSGRAPGSHGLQPALGLLRNAFAEAVPCCPYPPPLLHWHRRWLCPLLPARCLRQHPVRAHGLRAKAVAEDFHKIRSRVLSSIPQTEKWMAEGVSGLLEPRGQLVSVNNPKHPAVLPWSGSFGLEEKPDPRMRFATRRLREICDAEHRRAASPWFPHTFRGLRPHSLSQVQPRLKSPKRWATAQHAPSRSTCTAAAAGQRWGDPRRESDLLARPPARSPVPQPAPPGPQQGLGGIGRV